MQKKMTALLLAAILIVSAAATAVAVTNASDYLDGCIITTTPEGNRKIVIDYVVYGTDEMTELGATQIRIDRYDDYKEDWVYDRTLTGGSTKNDVSHAATTSFYGTRGEQYRAVIYAYAKDRTGSDSRQYEGSGVFCK